MPRKKSTSTIHGIKRDINCHGNPIEILALADLHIGDPNSNAQLIQLLIDSVRDNENRYCILVGDLMNTAITGSKSDSYSEKLKPSEQIEQCYDLLSPIADKILAIVPGNHEERVMRSVGIDMTRILARELDIEDVYKDASALLIVKMGKDKIHNNPIIYSFYINHGHGGGRRVGGKLNGLQDFAPIIDADCFVIGHTHLPASFKQSSYRINSKNSIATMHEQLFVNTASALNYGGYGKRGGYQPPSNSYPVITLDSKIHKLTVTL